MPGPSPSSAASTPAPPPDLIALITGGAGDLARALRADLENHGVTVLAPPRAALDVTSATSIASCFEHLTHLDLLVCNAGAILDKSMASMDARDFAAVIEVNLSGSFRVARAALKLMSRQRNGHIIFIGSHSAFSGPFGQSNYAAAKAGLIALTQSLAREYGGRDIRVNCVHPGFLETKMPARMSAKAFRTGGMARSW